MKASDVKGSEYNPRTIDEESQIGLSNSIERFQNISGITYNKRRGCLITGHQRWAELNGKNGELSLKKHKIEDENSVEWYQIMLGGKFSTFFLRVVDWDEDQEKAANVAGNAHTLGGKFDVDMLSTLLEDMDAKTKEALRFSQLEVDLGLNYEDSFGEKAEVGDLDMNDYSMPANILIKCNSADRSEIVALIKDMLAQTTFEGVSING